MDRIEAGKIYDSFDAASQDMPREAFIRKAMELTDANRMERELHSMVRAKRNKRIIEESLKNG